LDEPVLVDLGFATFQQDYKLLFSRCGTPGHVAPEVLNDKEYHTNADVYSLGIVLYMMVTKVNPFENSNYDILIQNNLNGEVKTALLTQPPYSLSHKGSMQLISYGFDVSDADCRPCSQTQSLAAAAILRFCLQLEASFLL
jgi:serine/threonine protein kinase